MYRNFYPLRRICLCALCMMMIVIAHSQSNGDYRSKQNGNWHDPPSWERFNGSAWANAVTTPTSSDGLISIRNGHTITIVSTGGDITADQVVVDAGGILTHTSVLNVADGSGNDLTVNGTINYNGGTLNGPGSTVISPAGILNIATTDFKLIGSPITNNGNINWQGGRIFMNADISIINNGTFSITSNEDLFNNGTVQATLVNNGTISKSSGGQTSVGIATNNIGSINLNAGVFRNTGGLTNTGQLNFNTGNFLNELGSGFFTFGSGSVIGGTGSFANNGVINLSINIVFPASIPFTITSHTSNISGTGNLTINNDLTMQGIIQGAGTLTINGNVTWNSGTIARVFTVGAGRILTFVTTDIKLIAAPLTNNGTMDWQDGNILFNSDVSITNNNQFLINSNSLLANNGGVHGTLINAGIITKNSLGVTAISITNVTNNNNAVIKGLGTISLGFSVTMTNSGIIAPGLSPGILTLNGGDPFGAASNLSIEIAGNGGAGQPTGHDQLQRAGNLTLNGNLAVIETGTVPEGDYIIISLTSGVISGTFSSANLPANYSVIYNSNNVVVRKGALTAWYRDLDGDGFGDPNNSVQAAQQPQGYVANNTDCNDNPAAGGANIHPAATEVCNNIDDDCDGQVDEGAKTTFYQDGDGDGFGNPSVTQQACSAPQGYVANNTDCNDNPAAGGANIHPGATEVCNNIDDDCDGQVDEGVTTTFYQDADGDGFGNPSVSQQACSAPQGYVANSNDCNDANAALNPNTIWYLDADNDNYYTGSGVTQCVSPGAGYKISGLTGGGDCNDNNNATHPDATEICNNADDDCDGQVDEGAQPVSWYRDQDGDGFGNPSVSQSSCTQPNGYVLNNTDCNDNNANVRPGATEVCNNIDDDCDGQTDEGVTTTFYQDADGDGFGNPSVPQQGCSAPQGFVANNTDCNDTNAAINPNTIWYLDADNDNYYTGSGVTQCVSPGTGYRMAGLTAGGDCNDNNINVHPTATEVCNNIDDDCDGQVDEGLRTTFYQDADGDGFGNPSATQQACSALQGYVTNNSDCNDASAAINPNTIWYLDADNDNYYTGSGVTQCVSPGTGYKMSGLSGGGDCNDNNVAIHPGATEICNNTDDDCDGQTDEGAQPVNWYRDQDGDGYGNPAVSQSSCSQPNGYVLNNTDCNDSNANVHPGATEVCNGTDDDCDGQTDEGVTTTFYRDQDGDGFGNPTVTQQACSVPQGYVSNNADCNDNSGSMHPGASELCGNGVDDDCDGQLDEGCQPNPDNDGDGYTVAQGDCNDNNAAIHPGAADVCGNGVDENCNGYVDENCLPNLPVLAVRTYPIKEGDAGTTMLEAEVKLDRPAPVQLQFNYATSNEDATAGVDYLSTNGVLIIPSGASSGVIRVRIIGDLARESNERLLLNFSAPVNVILAGDANSRIMIIDDDKGNRNERAIMENTIAESPVGIRIPNMVKRNHVWELGAITNSENEIIVVNTMGQAVFKVNNYRNNVSIGNVATGIYFYRIRVHEQNGSTRLYTGRLLVTE